MARYGAFLLCVLLQTVLCDKLTKIDDLEDLYHYSGTSEQITVQLDIAMEGYQNLKVLNLKTKLKYLVFLNGLKAFQSGAFEKLTSLFSLEIFNGKIPVIRTGTFTNLAVGNLYVIGSGVKELEKGSFGNLPNLDSLSFAGNNLTEISSGIFEKLPISVLNMARNQIKEIKEKALFGLRNLTNLILDGNLIENVKISDFLEFPGQLNSLSLDGNQIEKIPKDSFSKLEKLQFLNLEFNKIKVIEPEAFSHLRNLESLDLKGNQIRTFSGQADLGKLEFLNVESNHLAFLSKDLLEGLKALKDVQILDNFWGCKCLDFLFEYFEKNKIFLNCDNERNGTSVKCYPEKGCEFDTLNEDFKTFPDLVDSQKIFCSNSFY